MARLRRLVAAGLAFYSLIQTSTQRECTASSPCALGCCSEAGLCGYGPEYCGDGCQGTCDQKSECNPGWDSEQWSNKTVCPLKLCCSKYGLCGSAKDSCGDNVKFERPSCPSDTPISRVIGYFDLRSALGGDTCQITLPEAIPFGTYTHINWAFAEINPQTLEIDVGNSKIQEMLGRIGTFKLLQPDLQVWVAVGGWSFNDPGQATHTTFSDIASSKANQDRFIRSAIQFLSTYGFDGIDIDWEYPVAGDRGGKPDDYQNLVSFLQNMRDTFEGGQTRSGSNLGKGISMTLPASYHYLQNFDISNLQKYVDWFNIMTYDMHGAWDIFGQGTGPFANAHTNMTDIQEGLDLLWRNNIDPDKVVFGLSYYGRSFQLADPKCNTPGCTIASAGSASDCSNTIGVMYHTEIQRLIQDKQLPVQFYETDAVKAAHWENQWVSFDDLDTWTIKARAIRSQCIRGVMVWAISQDDDKGTNSKDLLRALDREVMAMPNFTVATQEVKAAKTARQCRWANCQEDCPPGFRPVPREGTNLMMTDHTHCPMEIGKQSLFCCPSDYEVPRCTWRGHRNSGSCVAGCLTGEVEVGTLSLGCSKSHQSACCVDAPPVRAYGKCKWHGTASKCSGSGGHAPCSEEYPHFIVATSYGFGGEQRCSQGAKSYCCSDPPPEEFTDCAWYHNVKYPTFLNYLCDPACPADSIKLAMQNPDCSSGERAYCCKGKPPTIDPPDVDFGSNAAKQFFESLKKWLDMPSCPTSLEIEPFDWPKDKRPERRSIAETARKRDRPRPKDCTWELWVRILSYATMLYTQDQREIASLARVWDLAVSERYSGRLSYAELSDWVRHHPLIDPRAFLREILLDIDIATSALDQEKAMQKLLCEYPSRQKRSAASISEWSLQRRTVSIWGGKRKPGPLFQTILQGINRGHLSLHYARMQWMGMNGGAFPTPEPFLELAYWIGPVPGQIPDRAVETALNLQRYRHDRSDTEGYRQDQWVVMHLHMSDVTHPQLFRQFNGLTYVAYNSIQVFHAQGWYNTGGWQNLISSFRANGYRTTFTHRGSFQCATYRPAAINGVIYLGLPLQNVDPNDALAGVFDTWAQNLHRIGYTGTRGLLPFLSAPGRLQNGEIDPNNPGFWIHPPDPPSLPHEEEQEQDFGTRSPYFNDWEPYSVSFTINPDGSYDWRPRFPPGEADYVHRPS